ncbi:MAG: sugar phosphate isomerase/epimerase [Chloroflexi bacterium]|nr:sugar phosphate isomerase/epimerase [Chloroflexota bacterium]
MKWDITLSTGMFLHQPLLDALPSIRDAGFRRIQISAFRPHFDYHNRELVDQVRQAADALGLRVTSMHAPYSESIDLTLLDDEARLAAVAEIEAAGDALAALGGRTLVAHAGSETAAINDNSMLRLRRSARSLSEIYKYCRQKGIRLAIEDMLGHLLGGRAGDLRWVLGQLPMQGVGVCLDTGHSSLTGRLMERVRLFGLRMVMIHAHDNKGKYDDHLPPGEGSIPWGPLLDAFADMGFQGELVLEIREEPDIAALLQRTLDSVCFLQRCAQGKPYSISID